MKAILALASEFIEGLANPDRGLAVNEGYGARLAELTAVDPEFEISLAVAANELTAEDVGLLPRSGWLWYARWLHAHDALLPDDLLVALYEGSQDNWFQLRILGTATRHPISIARLGDRPIISQDDPLTPFLARILERALGGGAPDVQAELRFALAWRLLVQFMQLSDDVALACGALLLSSRWEGREWLQSRFEELIGGLDPDTRDAWRSRLLHDDAGNQMS